MTTRKTPTTALLLVFISILQMSMAGVLYWKWEEDAANEFLEVKKYNFRLIDYFQRVKRDLFDLVDFEEDETTKPDENHNDEEVEVGLSSADNNDLTEKILRVSFTVVEPYIKSCSDRESAEFFNFSKSLANAVDELYKTSGVPGSQKTSLVTIHSPIHDDFSCKVTLDIVTTGYGDTDYIVNFLRNYIVTYNRLGATIVNADGFSAELIDPVCRPGQFRCESDGRCIEERRRCDGRAHCIDGSDELRCENDTVTSELRSNLSCGEGKYFPCPDGTTHREASTSNPTSLKAELELVKKRLDLIEEYLNETIHDINEENKSADYYYFMSLLPQMEKFPPLQRFRLRNKINQLIMDELNVSNHGHSYYPN